MPTTLFLVRAVVVAPLRSTFDHWYATDHLPWAVKAFKCEKAWRFWSALEPGVHYANPKPFVPAKAGTQAFF